MTYFSVRGPSITPRPPQGQPVVSALAHQSVPYRLVGRSADIGYVTPRDAGHARAIVAEIRSGQQAAGRAAETVHVFGDLVVFLDEDAGAAADRKARLDELAGYDVRQRCAHLHRDAVAAGRPAAGLAGQRPVRLPAAARRDQPRPAGDHQGPGAELQRRGAFRTAYEADTLRGLLGLARPASRYAIATS